MLLALASAVALVAFAGWSLWSGSREAEQRAAWTSARDARECARALGAVLRQREVLERCPDDARFRIEASAPVLDGAHPDLDVAWLLPRPAPRDVLLEESLRQAHLAEFVARDAAAARQRYDALLERLDDDALSRTSVLLRAAWQRHRGGCADARDALLERARDRLATARPEDLGDARLANDLASCALLDAARGSTPRDALALLAHAQPHIAAPTLRRLAEQADQTGRAAVERALVHHERLAARRALLRSAARIVGDAVQKAAGTSLARAHGDDVVLWFADVDDRASGDGALVPRAWLASLPGHDDASLPPVPDRGRLTFERPGDVRGEPVLDELAWVLPSAAPELPWFGRPTTLLLFALALLLLFAGSAWATLRGVSRAGAAVRARADFLAGVTHELKTPIASMRLIADVLHDDGDALPPDAQRRHLAMLTGEAARLTTLVDNVLDLGQIDRGERAYDLQPDDAADVVREVVAGYRPLAEPAGLTVALHEGPREAPALLDRTAIAQALRNLLENARKYAATGGRIDVHTSLRGDRFVVRVRDRGPGVPADEREHVFTRFVRGRAHRHGSVPGVGLGLFLSRAILRRHGGELVCVAPDRDGDGDGVGAAFELTLPRGGPPTGGREGP